MKTVYLAGPITGLTFTEASAWRATAAQRLEGKWRTLSPLRGKEHCDLGPGILPSNFDGGGEAVARDLRDIRGSQALLVNLVDTPIPSIGTVTEMGYAKGYAESMLFKPVTVTVLSPTYQERTSCGKHADSFIARHYPNPHEHVFVRELSDIVVPTLDDAIAYLLENA